MLLFFEVLVDDYYAFNPSVLIELIVIDVLTAVTGDSFFTRIDQLTIWPVYNRWLLKLGLA